MSGVFSPDGRSEGECGRCALRARQRDKKLLFFPDGPPFEGTTCRTCGAVFDGVTPEWRAI